MSIREFLESEKAKIEADERYHYEPAAYQINGPLALIQVSMEARMEIINQALAELDKP